MVKIFGDSGAIKEALHMNSVVANILHRSPEKMALRQAGLQVELEQALRSRADLAYCDRLVNALRLCCPWEATLFQAELERCRGNYNACCDLLRHITVSAEARIKCTSSLNNQFPSRSESTICPEPLSHLNLATFEDHVSVGGLVKIALIGLRAHLLLAEVFLSKGMCQKADKELNDAHCQAEKFRLSSGEAAILLLRQAVNVVLARSSQPVDSPTDQILSEILHRSDSCTRFRYSVFVSRLRLSYLSSDSDRLSFLKCHLQLLLNALEFHRSLDDRQQILLLLILLIAALHASGRIEERNRAVHALEELRSKHHLPICSARELAATLL
ncbi:unnamed protein product [Dicrocoelium dendriticum]|nr:unnamed protein product [Dicrocoelium dendriticum]